MRVALLVCRTCERCRLGHSAVLVLCGDDAGPGAESRRGQQRQLLHDAAAPRVVLGQLVEALLQRVAQEVQLLTGLIETSLSLKSKTSSVGKQRCIFPTVRYASQFCYFCLCDPIKQTFNYTIKYKCQACDYAIKINII